MPALDWLIARPIAHRGLHDAASGIVENTSSSVAAAIAAGYGIEVDLQITADGDAVMHHDDALGRLTDGSCRLDSLTAAALAKVPFKATADRIIRLGELCDLVAGRTTLLLELKSHYDGDRRLPRRVAEVLQSYSGPVAAMSFDPGLVAALREAAPRLVRGITAERWRRSSPFAPPEPHSRPVHLSDILRMRPQFIAYSVRDLPAPLPRMARSLLGWPVLTWTVRSDDDRARASRWADQMIFEGFRP
jgi:glycerophosphoryl diester phosphodiesterase